MTIPLVILRHAVPPVILRNAVPPVILRHAVPPVILSLSKNPKNVDELEMFRLRST